MSDELNQAATGSRKFGGSEPSQTTRSRGYTVRALIISLAWAAVVAGEVFGLFLLFQRRTDLAIAVLNVMTLTMIVLMALTPARSS